jgi:bifunctional oligoribonuclease and PAP phosphatase NrnA
MNNELNLAISQRITEAKSVVVVSHIRPDGDSIGSILGLGLALQNAGKLVQMIIPDGVPASFRHLPGSDRIIRHPSAPFDLVIVVDCSDLQRVGGALNGIVKPDITIDHHITNLEFGVLNLVDPKAVATSAILAKNIPYWGLTIDPSISAALLTGIISDSLGFRTSNMNPEALRLAADLVEKGANLPELYQQALSNHTYEALRYWGKGLSRLQREDGLVWSSLTLSDRSAVEYYNNDDADLVNILSTIDDVEMVVLFIEQKGNQVKISWRSKPGIDVSQIALQFGGGGHPAASGAEVSGSLEEVQKSVLDTTRLSLNKNVR